LAVLVPLLLICGAASSAAIVAYGTSPELARYAHGIAIIVLARRLEWPMVALSLLLCAVLLAITISGHRRVWWLLGLGPVLALFVRGFSSTYHPATVLLDSPQFVNADQADTNSLAQEYVIGLTFDRRARALPYRALAASPLILLSAFDQRALVIWSMTANRAMVLPLDRETSPREIEVVSSPADSLLIFDARLGQFIVGVTGRTVGGKQPVGFGAPLAVEKMPWPLWLSLHPDTLVMQSPNQAVAAASEPVLPGLQFPEPSGGPAGDARIAMLATTQPTAVMSDITLDRPADIQAGDASILLDRDPQTKMLRAFDRHLRDVDLFLTFKPNKRPSRKHPDAAMIDADSASLWTLDGRAIDGPLKGKRLREIAIDDGLYWGVMKFWIPTLKLVQAER
jgi:hypothetical protein